MILKMILKGPIWTFGGGNSLYHGSAPNSSYISLVWLHHNHKMSISYHKNALSVPPIPWQVAYLLCVL